MKVRIINAFHQQSKACTALGSPFTGSICSLFAERFNWNTVLGKHLENWSGNPESACDNVPLRLAGALNALVLSNQSTKLSAVYPPNHETSNDDQLWSAIADVLEEHVEFIIERMKLPPQTNELRRSAVLLPAFLAIADRFKMPMSLSEVGSSSGLNLLWDEYSYALGDFRWGDTKSGIHLNPDWSGPPPTHAKIIVSDRAGCDLNPLDLLDEAQRIQAISYIWPDQKERVERTMAAIELFEKFKPKIERSDALQWLDSRLLNSTKGVVHVVFHSIVLQYFPPEHRSTMESLLVTAGQAASEDAPLAWVQYEADGLGEGAGVSLTTWPGGANQQLGRADFHGRWITWNG